MPRSAKKLKRDVLLNFRVSEAEKSLWESEAKRRDVPLSQLIRHIVNEYFKDLTKTR